MSPVRSSIRRRFRRPAAIPRNGITLVRGCTSIVLIVHRGSTTACRRSSRQIGLADESDVLTSRTGDRRSSGGPIADARPAETTERSRRGSTPVSISSRPCIDRSHVACRQSCREVATCSRLGRASSRQMIAVAEAPPVSAGQPERDKANEHQGQASHVIQQVWHRGRPSLPAL